MRTATLPETLGLCESAGLVMQLTPRNGISVSPAKRLTPDLRDLIRQHRAGLVEFLAAQAAPTDPAPEPVPAPAADPNELWRQADRAYLGHHFGCRTCCSAGKGYGQRCAIGLELWTAYEAACDTRHAHTTPTRGRNPR